MALELGLDRALGVLVLEARHGGVLGRRALGRVGQDALVAGLKRQNAFSRADDDAASLVPPSNCGRLLL